MSKTYPMPNIFATRRGGRLSWFKRAVVRYPTFTYNRTLTDDAPNLVYGLYEPHESLAVGNEVEFRSVVSDLRIMERCTTVGAIRAALPELITADLLIDDAELAGTNDDETWNWQEVGAVADGDWPPMPTAAILELFPQNNPIWGDLTSVVGLEIVSTSLNGNYAWIDPGKEAQLLRVLRNHGSDVKRDDDLILAASIYG